MATISRKAYTTSLTSILTTELNSLATATNSAASSTVDNSTNLDLYADFLLQVTWGTNPTAGNSCDLYLIPSPDNTTFADGGGAVNPAKNLLVGSFYVRAVTTAQAMTLFNVLIPQYFKLVLINNTGQAMAATGNTLKYRTYSLQSV